MSVRRVTIRVLIIVVALVAVGVWGVKMWDRSTVFAQTAERHRQKMGHHLINCLIHEQSRRRAILNHSPDYWESHNRRGLDSLDAHIAAYRHDADYEEGLYRKYRRAANFPWWSVDADPPPPQPFAADLPWPDR